MNNNIKTVPFLINKSEGFSVDIDPETNTFINFPEVAIIDIISDVKDILKEVGYIDFGIALLYNITTDGFGFPISGEVEFLDINNNLNENWYLGLGSKIENNSVGKTETISESSLVIFKK